MDRFSTSITQWYRQNYRDLPWRKTTDPYKIWLSEIILQQTRVDQGMDYYLRFIRKYPTVELLAKAPQDEVLNLWQGLGYYSRARNLHAAAKNIHENYKNKFPDNFKEILDLKGVGDYTASAIASFAYDLPYAVVDGNVYRLLSRYLNISTPIDSTLGKKEFKKVAQELLDVNNPAIHNQAIMEMGALVCTPKNPDCTNCPLNESCLALELKLVNDLPVKEKKTKVRSRYFHYLVVIESNKVYLKKRGPKDVWQGLYDFPLIELGEEGQNPNEGALKLGFSIQKHQSRFKHILSHQRIFADFYLAKLSPKSQIESDFIQVELDKLDDFPMPQLLIRYLESSELFNAD